MGEVIELGLTPKRVLTAVLDEVNHHDEILIIRIQPELNHTLTIHGTQGINAIACLIAAHRLQKLADAFLNGEVI